MKIDRSAIGVVTFALYCFWAALFNELNFLLCSVMYNEILMVLKFFSRNFVQIVVGVNNMFIYNIIVRLICIDCVSFICSE